MMQVKWKIDDDAVEELRGMGVSYIVGTVAMDEIDLSGSRENGARAVPIINDNVDDYADAMQLGDEFPCIVLVQIGTDEQYTIAGGNHRHAAALLCEQSSLLAICCKMELADFLVLSARLNRKNGQRENRQDRLEVAARSVAVNGLTQKEAAALYGVSTTALSGEIAAREIERELVRVGRDGKGLCRTALRVLSRLKNDSVCLPIAHDIAAAGVSSDRLKETLQQASKQRSEAGRRDYLQSELDKLITSKKRNRGLSQPIASAVRVALGKLKKAVERGAECQMQMEAAEVKQVAQDLQKVADVVKQMATSAK